MTHLASGVDPGGAKVFFVPFAKIDEDKRMVYGYASTETRDQQGEIVRRSAIADALPDYMRFGNIREMHQPSAVGLAKEASVDNVGLFLGAHVLDDRAWTKTKGKVYKGFSIGGRVKTRDPNDPSIITALELTEISLVDRPANPDAVFTVVKRVDGVLRPQPIQKWDCGIAEHQHTSKVEAADCLQKTMSRLESLSKGSELHTGETDMTRSVDDAAKAADDAVAKLAASIGGDAISKDGAKPPVAAVDHNAGARTHWEAALNADKKRQEATVAAATSKENAKQAEKEKNPTLQAQHTALASDHEDEAKAAGDEADFHYEQHARHAVAAAREADMSAKAVAPVYLAFLRAVATDHAGGSDRRKAIGKTIESGAVDLAKLLNISVITKLELDPNGFDKETGDWFGKREFTDKERQAAADKGHAMPDGSFPIENKDDLHNAIQAHGRAKNPDKAKAHIKARAKALGASDMLPDEWKKGMGLEYEHHGVAGHTIMQEHHVSTDGTGTSQGTTSDADKNPTGSGHQAAITNATATATSAHDKVAEAEKAAKAGSTALDYSYGARQANKAPEPKPLAKAAETPAAAAVSEDAKKAKKLAKVKRLGGIDKGMSIIAELANMLEMVSRMCQNSALEQLYEGDKDDDTPQKLHDWLQSGATLLQHIVAQETAELVEDEDVDVVAAAAQPDFTAAFNSGAWALSVAKALQASAGLLAKVEDSGRRVALKTLAEKFEKIGARNSKADRERIQKIHDHAADLGADCSIGKSTTQAQLGKVGGERDRAVAALDKFTQTVVALNKNTDGLKAELAEVKKTNSELTATVKKQETEIARLSSLPLPSKGHGVQTRGLRKADDTGGATEVPVDATLAAMPANLKKAVESTAPGPERAEALAKVGYIPRYR